jgi:hypothetical protein
MTTSRDGLASSRKGRGGRTILSLDRTTQPPQNCSQLPGNERSNHSGIRPENQPELTPAERFEVALWNARNEWSIRRHALPADAEDWVRGGGFAGMGRIDKTQADRLWTKAKTAFAGAGAQ